MDKLHCDKCGLYLGHILVSQNAVVVSVVCPVCERARDEVKLHLRGEPISHYTEGEKSWLSEIMQRQVKDYDATNFVRRIREGLE